MEVSASRRRHPELKEQECGIAIVGTRGLCSVLWRFSAVTEWDTVAWTIVTVLSCLHLIEHVSLLQTAVPGKSK